MVEEEKPPPAAAVAVARRRRMEIRRMRAAAEMVKRSRVEKRSSDSGSSESSSSPSIGSSLSSSSPSSSSSEDVDGIDDDLRVGILVTGDEGIGVRSSVSHGLVSVCGRRREMEDAVTAAPGLVVTGEGESDLPARYDFYGVYDGHGGALVAEACRARLHKIVEAEVGRSGGEVDWKAVMEACFAKMDGELVVGDGVEAAKTMGSTAVVAMVGKENLVVANCGDSRAVLSRGGVAVPLSNDHKPDRPDELERVEAAGGRVIKWDGYRVLGVLATSRSIGDQYLKPFVISVPEVVVTSRTDMDEFLILASDGLWDVVTNDMACDITRQCLSGQSKKRLVDTGSGRGTTEVAEAAAMLVELAMGRGSSDNISVIVVDLCNKSSR